MGGEHRAASLKRSSKVASLPASSSAAARAVARRLQRATGLDTGEAEDTARRSSEQLQVGGEVVFPRAQTLAVVQVMNYGLGGTVQGHLDTVATSALLYRDPG